MKYICQIYKWTAHAGLTGCVSPFFRSLHDYILEDEALTHDLTEQIYSVMKKSSDEIKQEIIALDKQSSYTEKAIKALNDKAVLRLYPGGGEMIKVLWVQK